MCAASKNNSIENGIVAVQQLDNNLGFLVNGLARLMRNALEERLRQVGLTPTSWSVLMAVGEEDGLSQRELGRRTFLDGATVTRALDILEAKSLIERKRDEIDRRVQTVGITRAGKKMMSATALASIEVNDDTTAILERDERECLEDALRRLISHSQSLINNEVGSEK